MTMVPTQTTVSEAGIPLTQANILYIIEVVLTNLPQQQDTSTLLNANPPDPESDSLLGKHS